MKRHVSVTDEPLDPAAWLAESPSLGDLGAMVLFAGWCRSEAGRLTALELEHYPGMAEAEINRIVDAAGERWPLLGALVVHRTGVVPVGEAIVIVGTASAHRGSSIEATAFIMDFLKTDAPFWKREQLADGTLGPWIDARSADEAARDRWWA